MMSKGDSWVLGVILVVVGFGMIAVLPSSVGQGTVTPVLHVDLDGNQYNADVKPGGFANGTVVMHGTVACDTGEEVNVTVNFTCYTDGWPWSVSPANHTFHAGGPNMRTIQATLTVPVGSLMSDKRNVSVGGNWTGGNGSNGTARNDTVMINILPYFGLETTALGSISVDAGKRKTIQVTVTNRGNGEDDFYIELASGGDRGWSASDSDMLRLGPDGSGVIEFSVKAPEESGTYDLGLVVISHGSALENPDGMIVQELDIKAKVEKDDAFPFISGLELMAVIATATLFFTVRRRK